MTRREILAALRAAERARQNAVAQLAALSIRSFRTGFMLSPSLRQALTTHRRRIEAAHGYRGHAVGWKLRNGRLHAKPGITVFVESKVSEDRLSRMRGQKVPCRLETSAGKVDTDVVELALHARQAGPGGTVAREGSANAGTIGCMAFDDRQNPVAVTAGHVATKPGFYVVGGQRIGQLERSMQSPVDAAAISVGDDWSVVFPDGSHMVGARVLTEQDVGITVSMYGAQSGGWSAGRLIYLAARIDAWNVEDAVIYTAPSNPGDSGGPVVDEHGYLVGLHIGRGRYHGQDVAIAGALGRVVHELRITPAF